MKFLLDTCTISDFVKGEPATLTHIKTLSPNILAVSVITIMEIHYGLLLNPKKSPLIRPMINDFIAALHTLPFTSTEALEAGNIRSRLKTQGKPIGYYDILIAATAMQHNLILVTSNVGESERIDNLKITNWREHEKISPKQ